MSQIVVTAIKNPPGLMISAIDPDYKVIPATGDLRSAGSAWNANGVHLAVPLEKVDQLVEEARRTGKMPRLGVSIEPEPFVTLIQNKRRQVEDFLGSHEERTWQIVGHEDLD